MERTYDHNSKIVFVDSKGDAHAALVTVWWKGPSEVESYTSASNEPGCNLAYVSKDPSNQDPCGRRIVNATSVVHKSKQAAPGNFWCWPDELI